MSKFSSVQNKAFWNKRAEIIKDSPIGAHSDKHVVDLENHFIESELRSRKITSLLDIGCGNGQRTFLFSKYVIQRVLGIDYSYKMIQYANTLRSKKSKKVRKIVNFEVQDIHHLVSKETFDVVVSCRSFVNQTSSKNQTKLFEIIHKKLRPGGSLLIAEQSMEGMKRLNGVRRKFGLGPIKVPWHNLPINEFRVFGRVSNLFKIERINRLGIFYYISRVIHPAQVYPSEPNPNAKINDLALKTEMIFQKKLKETENPFEDLGAHLLIHFVKK